jgi:hypothetical protein
MKTTLAEMPYIDWGLGVAVKLLDDEIEKHLRTYGEHGLYRNHLRELRLAQTYINDFINRNFKTK